MKPDTRIPAILATLLLSVAFTTPVQAQYTNNMRPGVNFTNAYAANADIILSSMQKRVQMNSYVNSIRASQAATAGRSAAPAAVPAAKGPTSAPRQPLTATDFKPAGARDMADKIAAAAPDPASRKEMAKALRQVQPTIEATPGFRRNNLASALTLMVAGSLQVLAGIELNERQLEGLLLLVNDEVVATGGLARLSAAQRTRFYDALVITSGLMLGIANNAAQSGDREQAEIARTMARDGLASVGIRW